MQPNRRFLLADPAHFVALGFGSGLWPKGPGTAGTLAGWLLFPFVKAPLSDPLFGALLVACFLFGIIACERTGRSLGVADHGAIVWDEIVAIWLVLWLTPSTLAWQATAQVETEPLPIGCGQRPQDDQKRTARAIPLETKHE